MAYWWRLWGGWGGRTLYCSGRETAGPTCTALTVILLFEKILNDKLVITDYFYFLNLNISDISLLVIIGFTHVYIQNFYSDDLACTVLKTRNEFLSYKKPTIFIKMKKVYLNNCTYFFSLGFSAFPKMI